MMPFNQMPPSLSHPPPSLMTNLTNSPMPNKPQSSNGNSNNQPNTTPAKNPPALMSLMAINPFGFYFILNYLFDLKYLFNLFFCAGNFKKTLNLRDQARMDRITVLT